jgi:hypothetical protein
VGNRPRTRFDRRSPRPADACLVSAGRRAWSRGPAGESLLGSLARVLVRHSQPTAPQNVMHAQLRTTGVASAERRSRKSGAGAHLAAIE